MSAVRSLLGGLAGLALVAAGAWGLGPGRVVAPALVVPAQAWTLSHSGDGALRWALTDGSQPGGPVVRAEGVLLAERGGRLELALAPGIDDGASVAVDAPVVQVRRPALQSAATARDAEAAAAAAELAALAKGSRDGPAAAAVAQVAVARASLDRALRAEAVARELASQGGAGAWEAELAALEVSVQRAALRAAEAAVAGVRNLPLDEELAAAQARVDAAAAAADEARARAAAAPLASPLAGTVHRPGGAVVLAVHAAGDTLVQAALPEAQRAAWPPGTALHFQPTAGGAPVAATVLRVGDGVQASAAGPRVWVVARLAGPVAAGATGVLQSAPSWGAGE